MQNTFHRDEFLPPALRRAKKLAWLLDEAITLPVIKQKIGLDPIIGALPGAGDAVMILLSLYPVWVAYELNLPRKILVRMAVNILIDQLISIVPLVGDVSDVFWKANAANVRLLEEAYFSEQRCTYQPEVIDISAVSY